MEQRNQDVVEIDLKELIFVLIHKLWIVILVGIIAAGVAGAVSSFLITPKYTSSTSVFVINRQNEEKMTLTDLQTGTQLTKDFMIVVKSRPVMEKVIENLNLDMTTQQLADLITVNTPQDTRILDIFVEHPDPQVAKLIADSVAEISSEQMVQVMNMEKVNVVEDGNFPTEPSSPNVLMNTILGGLVGVVIACFAIVLIYTLNDSIRTTEDIERYLGITALGILPLEPEADKKSKKRKGKKKGEKKYSKRNKKKNKKKDQKHDEKEEDAALAS